MAISLFHFDMSKTSLPRSKLSLYGCNQALDAGLYLRDGVARDVEFSGDFAYRSLVYDIRLVNSLRLRRKRRLRKCPLNRRPVPRKLPFHVHDRRGVGIAACLDSRAGIMFRRRMPAPWLSARTSAPRGAFPSPPGSAPRPSRGARGWRGCRGRRACAPARRRGIP